MHTRPMRLPALVAVAVFAWSCSAGAGTARTAPAAPIDLPTAIALALGQPGLRAAAHEVAATEAAAGQAGLYPNPELEFLREGQRAGTRTTTVQITQPFELGGKRRARVALAQGASALARNELAARRQAIRAEVSAAYYTVLVGQERQALAQSLSDLARQSVEVAARRVLAGKISPIDETRARLAAVDASTEGKHADAELALARIRLGALIGKPAASIVLASGPAVQLPELAPLPTLLSMARNAGAIQRARSRLTVQEAQADVERAARMPDLRLSIGTRRDEEAGRRQGVLGLSVPLPLFNRNQGALAAALSRSDGARDELAAAEAAALAELASAHTRYLLAREEAVALQQEVIPSARSAYALTLKGFDYGKFSFLDVLDAQRSLFQVQTRSWNALLDAWLAYSEIERLAGAAQASAHTGPTESDTTQ